MSTEKTVREEIREALARGPMSSGEIVEVTKLPTGSVTSTLNSMRKAGEVVKEDGYGAPWALVPGGVAAKPKSAKKSAAKKSNGNGHAKANGSNGGAKSLYEQLVQQLVADHAAQTERLNKKLDALKVLAED